MGCGNCGTGASGKPSGCKGNGGCSTGGCNRMNVFDWLSELPLPLQSGSKLFQVIEVSFNKGSRKDFYRNNTSYPIHKGEMIVVEGVSGFDVGEVSLTGELVKLQMKKYDVKDNADIKKVLRPATDADLEVYYKNKERENEVMIRARAVARTLNLQMKIAEVEMQADGKKATFFYTADDRVDFRELIKIYASEFKVKVEMRQIGARQESGKVGGIGSCGRELCCSTWLTDFKSVNTTAARYQNLSINQVKLSGQCGRLKCCLNYELDTYMDALSVFPDHADTIQTAKGNAYLQKRDIFKNLMWYSFPDSSKQYPLSIVRVKEILTLNKQGIKPDELQPVELEISAPKAAVKVDMGFVNDVGHISLKSLEKGNNKKKKDNRGGKPGADARGGQQQSRGGDNRGREQRQGQNQEQRNREQRPVQNADGRNRDQRPQQQKPQGNRPPQQAKPEGQTAEGRTREQRRPDNRPPREQRPQQERPEGQPREPRPDNRPPREPRPQQQARPEEQQQAGQREPRQDNRPPREPRPPRPQGNRPPRPPRPEGERRENTPPPAPPAQ